MVKIVIISIRDKYKFFYMKNLYKYFLKLSWSSWYWFDESKSHISGGKKNLKKEWVLKSFRNYEDALGTMNF